MKVCEIWEGMGSVAERSFGKSENLLQRFRSLVVSSC